MPTCVPPLPPAWQGTEQMRDWLRAKAEEDIRRQQEEKTRQATLILEQRRVEHAMVTESLRAGVPPHLIPMMFNGFNAQDSNSFKELQKPWSGPGTMTHQQSISGNASTQQTQPPHQAPPQPHQPAKVSYSKWEPQFKKKQSPGMDQPSLPIAEAPVNEPVAYSNSLEAAFHDTSPYVASLGQASRSHVQSKPLESPSQARGTQYQYWTPKGQWSLEPQHPIRQQQSQNPNPNPPVPKAAPKQGQERRPSGTKRKDTRSHGKTSSLYHPSGQSPAEGSHAQLQSIHKRHKSDISSCYDSRGYRSDYSEPSETPASTANQQPLRATPTTPSAQPSAQPSALGPQTSRSVPNVTTALYPWIDQK
jgi:hypothetical protein